MTTVDIAGLYEYQAGATTLYYEGNALRRTGYAADNGVFYNLRDQLNSASVLINQNGTVNGNRNYFFPFGGNRGGTAFNGVTTKRFTGQYHEAGLPGGEGLSYYGARWYDAQVGRFLSADTIVPKLDIPQDLNRYSYVRNNPVKFQDPSGHQCWADGDIRCDGNGSGTNGTSGGPNGAPPPSTGGWFGGLGQSFRNWWSGPIDMSVYELQTNQGSWEDLYTWQRGGLTIEEAGHMAQYTLQNNATVLYRPRPYGAVLGESWGLANKSVVEETVGGIKAWGIQLAKPKGSSSWWPGNWRVRVSDTDVNAIVIRNEIAPLRESQSIAAKVAQVTEINGSHNIQHGCNFWGVCQGASGATWGRQEQPVYAMRPDGTITYWSNGVTALNYYAPGWSSNSAFSLIGPR